MALGFIRLIDSARRNGLFASTRTGAASAAASGCAGAKKLFHAPSSICTPIHAR